MSDMDLAQAMWQLEEAALAIPRDELRHFVVLAESQEGKVAQPDLPSGNAFSAHTRRARLWVDFLDDLHKLSE